MDAACTMLEATIAWRSSYKPEEIGLNDIEAEAITGKMYISPYLDLEGLKANLFTNKFSNNKFTNAERPIVVMRPGLDTTTDKIAKVKYLVWIVENVTIFYHIIGSRIILIGRNRQSKKCTRM